MRLAQFIRELRSDIAFAFRQLRRSPGFTFVAALTLALGIGANSAIFALVDAALLRPLPFHDPERLVMLWESSSASPAGMVSPLNLEDWEERTRTFEGFSGFIRGVGAMVMAGADGTADAVARQWVADDLFEVLGVQPVAGRLSPPPEAKAPSNNVVISEAFWHTRFGGDPSVIGRQVRLDGEPYTVLGVVPRDVQLVQRTSIWGLLSFQRIPQMRTVYALQGVARLKPQVTLDAARADLASAADALAREFPETNAGRGVVTEPLRRGLVGNELRITSMLFLGVVGFVLLICCANVANLLLARATARSRELALRAALGASRRRVVRQLLTESLVLSMIGGAAGLLVGAAILRVAPQIMPPGLLPAAVTLTFDARVVAFCAAAAAIVGVLFGLAPTWHATGTSVVAAITAEGRAVTGRGGRIRNLLVAAEVATAVVLLFGAGLLLRTLLAVEGIDPGYRAERVLTMMVDPLASRYPNPEAMLQFFDSVEREIRAQPAVRSVAWASTLPLGASDAGERFFEVVGSPRSSGRRPTADYQIVSPAYFETIGLPIVAGRPFTEADADRRPLVAIVNEAFASRHFPGRSPIGARIAIWPAGTQAEPVVREIVGVARQVKGRPDELADLVQIYVPIAQNVVDDIYLVVAPNEKAGDDFARAVRAAVARVDPEQLVGVRSIMTLEEVAWEATARHRFRAAMVMTFAALALVLAMIGVFGVLAYAVQQRTRDIGVRRALGASTRDVVRLVAGNAAKVVVSGAAVGVLLSVIAGRFLEAMLFGVRPLDVTTFVAVAVVLALTAMVAAAGPARRAIRIDPAAALRAD